MKKLIDYVLGLTTTGKSTRTRGKIVPQTPATTSKTIMNPNFTGLPMITPKFDPATPLTRTAMRTQRADEKFLVSMNGSPVYVAKGKSKTKDNFIPVPLGDGKTMVVPANNPAIKPLLDKLVKECMGIMNKEKS